MARSYVKSKRAENQAETRQRIVEAAVALHGEIGPIATTISTIAERAGVQRHTVYAHFADEKSLFMACSGLHAEQHPLPSPDAWATINDPATRLSAALSALYAWFAENESMARNVLRDAETNDALRDVSSLRFGRPLQAIHDSLSEGLGEKGRATLSVAMSFYTWRTLTHEARLKLKDAVAVMGRTVLTADTAE
jgi:AcrR family transcriptional regulator